MTTRVRFARFVDVPAVTALIARGWDRTSHADTIRVVPERLRETVEAYIAADRRHGAGAACVLCADRDGDLVGVLMGVVAPFYGFTDALEASDLVWYAEDGTSGPRLMRVFHAWAQHRGASVIRQTVTDAIVDPAAAGRLLGRQGLTEIGHVYMRRSAP